MKKGFRINLRAGEKIYINGAVLCVDRKVSLEFLNDVAFLLESHVLSPDETTTPLRQLYYMIQTMLIEPGSAAAARGMFDATLPQLLATFNNRQVLEGLRMDDAAVRLAHDVGCVAIGIQYQQGLKDTCVASDLAEGLLNNPDRPPVFDEEGRELRAGQAVRHFNEVDECAGVDGVITDIVWRSLGMDPSNTLHDVRWGAPARERGLDGREPQHGGQVEGQQDQHPEERRRGGHRREVGGGEGTAAQQGEVEHGMGRAALVPDEERQQRDAERGRPERAAGRPAPGLPPRERGEQGEEAARGQGGARQVEVAVGVRRARLHEHEGRAGEHEHPDHRGEIDAHELDPERLGTRGTCSASTGLDCAGMMVPSTRSALAARTQSAETVANRPHRLNPARSVRRRLHQDADVTTLRLPQRVPNPHSFSSCSPLATI